MMMDFPPFRPHPLLRSGHSQTIAGSFLTGRSVYAAQQHTVPLEDGDAVVLHDDCPAAWAPTDRAVILVHGLCGSHQSGYVARTAAKLNSRGVRTFRMDLRAHGAGLTLATQVGHAGRSSDVGAALARVMQLCPQAQVHLVGFSMGGNIVLKLAGEFGRQAPTNLAGVFAAAPPVDLQHCCENLRSGWNFVYDRAFTRNLKRHYRQWQRENAGVPPTGPRPIKRIIDFDEHVTAPRSGYRNANDYYSHASSAPHLTSIRVPTIILTAADDPIIPVRCVESVPRSASTQLVISEHGGHLGFVGKSGLDADNRWLDWRIVDWVIAERKATRQLTPESHIEPECIVLAPAVCRSA